ncbi:hypothetical protein KD146_15200 [Devosia sp. BSSL-BM10]|uniref:Uncharacterized protein n=1 Tax=Devosia litorisediminis TaxID=2829817 RepID=A0A942ED45_9HYPH|nr:hypothetical protein [Devosia litorisediminis]MBS3850047.1 hypothetical protein [Devosia litorisediminis]
MSNLVSMAVGVIGLAALGASAWVYAETQRDIRRVSTDIAQIRVSLELFGRQQGAGSSAASDDGALLDLSNRLAVLEAEQRMGGAATALSSLPGLPSATAETPTIATGGDCLPVGMRFMVSAGDVYPVCGTSGTVGIAAVDDGYITLSDGTIIARGGTVGLPNTQCMLGVVPSDGGGVSDYAEIRVVC